MRAWPTNVVELSGLEKSFRATSGRRSTRCGASTVDPRRRDHVALLGPNGAGKSTTIDMLLGPARPDAGSVSLLGVGRRRGGPPPARSARCCRPAALLRDLTVRELVAMMASLYPRAARRRRGARPRRDRARSPTGAPRSLSGGADAARALRARARQRPRPAGARRADGRDGRRGRAARSGPTMRAVRRRAARRSCSRPTTSRRPTPTPTAPC